MVQQHVLRQEVNRALRLMQTTLSDLEADLETLKPAVTNLYVFCFVWSIGAGLDESVWERFDELVREGLDRKSVV